MRMQNQRKGFGFDTNLVYLVDYGKHSWLN